MICDRDDARVMSGAYQISPRGVELMCETERATLAQQQRGWFYANIATAEKTASELETALRVAVSSERVTTEEKNLVAA
jgi:hypothetical protein